MGRPQAPRKLLRVRFAVTCCLLQHGALCICMCQALTFAKHVSNTVAYIT